MHGFHFLSAEVPAFTDSIKSDFDKVLSRECEAKKFFGNVCGADITPATTKVYDNLADDDEEYANTCCEVDTKELQLLIDEWCDALKEFKKRNHKNTKIWMTKKLCFWETLIMIQKYSIVLWKGAENSTVTFEETSRRAFVFIENLKKIS
ncbi:MAG: hypothetical protein J1D88_06465 [Treponema sp.]|nr:hypothetical protein [Treponema sp.]